MRYYSNSHERQPKHPRKKVAHPAILILAVLILTCVVAWHVGSHIASGSTAQEGLMLNDIVTSNPGYLPQPERSFQAIASPTPYLAAAQTFTFAELTALSNDHLLLVNPDYAVPDYVAGSLAVISNYVTTLNSNTLLKEDALVMLRVMFDSAAHVGLTQFRVTQGFRTHDYQQSLYDQMAGTGLAARPGHSEHQVGLAVDISYHGVNIGNSAQGNWLMNYSYRYGFILRYPQHKTHITGVPFEPWHYRYVGQPHAYFMTLNDMVMEEYIAYLRDNREITVVFDGVEFFVFYLNGEGDTIEIPAGHQFWASRDNTGGIIVTVQS